MVIPDNFFPLWITCLIMYISGFFIGRYFGNKQNQKHGNSEQLDFDSCDTTDNQEIEEVIRHLDEFRNLIICRKPIFYDDKVRLNIHNLLGKTIKILKNRK